MHSLDDIIDHGHFQRADGGEGGILLYSMYIDPLYIYNTIESPPHHHLHAKSAHVIDDADCPYWDQALLNNIQLKLYSYFFSLSLWTHTTAAGCVMMMELSGPNSSSVPRMRLLWGHVEYLEAVIVRTLESEVGCVPMI